MDSNSYTLLVIDPVNQANFYMKTFLKEIDYNG